MLCSLVRASLPAVCWQVELSLEDEGAWFAFRRGAAQADQAAR